MSRCKHGFLAGVVTCPEGCHSTTPVRPLGRLGRARRRSDSEIVQAIESTGSASAAANLLGYTATASVYARAKLSPAVRKALHRGRPVTPSGKVAHPSLRDMTGQVVGTWTVLERASNTSNGTAQWLCRHECGEVEILEGIALRGKLPRFCSSCRPQRYRKKGL